MVGVIAGAWNIGPDDKALTARGILASSTSATIAAGQAVFCQHFLGGPAVPGFSFWLCDDVG